LLLTRNWTGRAADGSMLLLDVLTVLQGLCLLPTR
jgi:hypothetical protein